MPGAPGREAILKRDNASLDPELAQIAKLLVGLLSNDLAYQTVGSLELDNRARDFKEFDTKHFPVEELVDDWGDSYAA